MEELFAHQERIGCGALLMLDADGLKKINDIYGHRTGDAYLKRISQVIGSISEEHTVCAGLGGDEFVVFLYGYQSCEEINQAISELKKSRGEDFEIEDPMAKISVEFSLGLAYYPADGTDYNVLMHMADENMYQEKKNRKKERI